MDREGGGEFGTGTERGKAGRGSVKFVVTELLRVIFKSLPFLPSLNICTCSKKIYFALISAKCRGKGEDLSDV